MHHIASLSVGSQLLLSRFGKAASHFFLCLARHVGRKAGCDEVEAYKWVCLLHFCDL